MSSRRDAKKLIIKALRQHPEGLMLTELAAITGMNRFTVTKYIHELKGAGSIFQKSAAAAKICYLKENLVNEINHRGNTKGSLSIKKNLPFTPILIGLLAITTILVVNLILKNQILMSKFSGSTTDISSVDVSHIQDFTLEIPEKGKIIYGEVINLSGGADLDKYVTISDNLIEVDSDAIPQLNKRATLYLYNLPYFFDPIILKNGKPCPSDTCELLNYDNGVLEFSVIHFTGYASSANSNLTIWDDTETQTKYVDEQIKFYANYTNSTSGESINGTGVFCNITFNITGGWTAWKNMTFNSSSLLYEYNRSFSDSGTFNWNVSCDGSVLGYELLNTTDNVTVSSPWLNVTLIYPNPSTYNETNPLGVIQNTTFNVNSTVQCIGGDCGNVYGSVRYNETGITPNQLINTTEGATPFYITYLTAEVDTVQYKRPVNWTVSGTVSNPENATDYRYNDTITNMTSYVGVGETNNINYTFDLPDGTTSVSLFYTWEGDDPAEILYAYDWNTNQFDSLDSSCPNTLTTENSDLSSDYINSTGGVIIKFHHSSLVDETGYMNVSDIYISLPGNTYDFKGMVNPSTTLNATSGYGGLLDQKYEGTELTTPQYQNISMSDENWTSQEGGEIQSPFFKFHFKVNETVSQVEQMGVRWEGYGTSVSTIFPKIYIWNVSTNSYDEIGVPNSSTTQDVIFYKEFNENINNYIDSDNYVHLLVKGKVGIGQYLYTDYIKVDVTLKEEGENPISCGSMSKGDSCQLNWTINTTGNINDVYVIDVNFSSNPTNDTENAFVKITGPVPETPQITLYQAGNIGENAFGTDATEKYFYRNSTWQNEDFMYINASITDLDGISIALLEWHNQTGQYNMSMSNSGDFYYINMTNQPSYCCYTFNIYANDSTNTWATYKWTFYSYTSAWGDAEDWRKYVGLNSTTSAFSYKQFYLWNYSYDPASIFAWNRSMKFEQPTDGGGRDSAPMYSDRPTENMETYCTAYIGFYPYDTINITDTTIENIYIHAWWNSSCVGSVTVPYITIGYERENDFKMINDFDESYTIYMNETEKNLTISGFDDAYYTSYGLESRLWNITDVAFGDNEINILAIKFWSDYAGSYPSVISTPHYPSFIIFNVPDNDTLEGLDTDSDSLSDFDELFTYWTDPNYDDTDGDGLKDNIDPDPLLPSSPPKYSDNVTNDTVAGTTVLFSLKWTDNVGLSGYIFSTNNSGIWENDTWIWFPGIVYDTPDMIALYHFNNESAYGENDTYIYDFTGNGNNGTANYTFGGDGPDLTTGKIGHAFSYSNDYFRIGPDQDFDSTNITIMAWIKRSFTGTRDAIVIDTNSTQGEDGHALWFSVFNNDTLRFKSTDGGTNHLEMFSSATIDTNWHHVAVVRNNTHAAFFIDGELDASGWHICDCCDNIKSLANDDYPYQLQIGEDFLWTNGFSPFDGVIDEVAIFNRSLSGEEIQNYYLTANESWSNVTKILNSTVGQVVGWRVYANDTSNNWNASEIFSLTTTDGEPPQIEFVSPTYQPNALVNGDWSYVNVSITDDSDTSSFIDWNRSLVGYWSFESVNASNYTYDNSTWGNDGQLMNGSNSCFNEPSCIQLVDGKFGNALKFDGPNENYVAVNDSPLFGNMSQLTVEAWVKLDTLPSERGNSNNMIVHKGHTVDPWQSFTLYVTDDDNVTFGVINESEGSGYSGTTEGLTKNTWYHIVGVYNGTDVFIYINGTMPNGYINSLSGSVFDSNGSLEISYSYYEQSINGTIDEVRIWNRALSPEEINASYNSGLYRLYHNFTDLNDGSYEYYAYAIDTSGNWNKTETRTLTVDTQAPKWFDNSTNNTVAGKPTEFRLRWTDNIGLNGYIYSTNNTGTWENDSWVDFENQTGDAIFIDGFETNDFSKWTGQITNGGGTVATSSDNVHHGTYSANITIPSHAGAYGRANEYKTLSTTYSELFFREYVKWTSGGPTNAEADGMGVGYISIGTSLGETSVIALVYNDTGTYKWAVRRKDGAVWDTTVSTSIVEKNKWYSVEIKANSTGYTLYINGSNVLEESGLTLSSSWDNILIGSVYTPPGTHSWTFYVDRVAVSTSYIGPDEGWSNVTKTLNSTVGANVQWRVYANDTSNNWNASEIFSLTTTSAGLTTCQDLTDPDTTYTLANDVNSTGTCFNILANNITLDCQGHMINYSQSVLGYAVNSTGYNYTTVKNCEIYQGNSTIDNCHGIYFSNSKHGNITNNSINITVTSNYAGSGISLYSSSNNNTVSNNTIKTKSGVYWGRGIDPQYSSNNSILSNTITTDGTFGYGIHLYFSPNNNISNNNITTLGYGTSGVISRSSNSNTLSNNTITAFERSFGIELYYSSNNILSNNTMTTLFRTSLSVDGNTISHFNHTIDESNLAHGKPIKYYFNQNNTVIENNDTWGELLVTVSSNITIKNITIINANNIFLSYTDNSKVENCNISNATARGAIRLTRYSTSNNITNNILSTSVGEGFVVYLVSSSENNISNNTIKASGTYGYGIHLYSSSNNNTLFNNNIVTSGYGGRGVRIESSNSSSLSNNIIKTNGSTAYGIHLYSSSNNRIYDSKINATHSNANDIYITGTNNYTNYLINCTFNQSDVGFYNDTQTDKIEIQWYLDVYVNDTLGNPLNQANVTAWMNNGTQAFTSLTEETGYIERQILTEYMHNTSHVYPDNVTYLTNYTVNATKTDYTPDSKQVNLTKSKEIFLTLQGDTDSPQIEFVPPTPPNGDVTNKDFTYVNVSIIDDSNTSSFIDWNRSLVGYWAMDWYNSTGIYDNSTYNNFGTFNGGLGTNNITTGEFGYGLEFDGSDDYISVPDSPSLDITEYLTISSWIKLNGIVNNQFIVEKGQSDVDNYGFHICGSPPDELSFEYHNGTGTGGDNHHYSTQDGTEINLQPNIWYHVAVVFNKTHVKLYRDGEEVYIDEAKGDLATNNNQLLIGPQNAGTMEFYFNGTMDEVRIWNRALSPEEINASYNSGLYRLYNNFTFLEDGFYEYYAYSIDSSGNANKTETRTLTVDTEAPKYSDNSTNNTVAGQPIEFRLRWTDNVGLGGYIFSTNNTGTWVNDTWFGWQIASCDSLTNWTSRYAGQLSLNPTDKQEGSASIVSVSSSDYAWFRYNISENKDWSSYNKLTYWMKVNNTTYSFSFELATNDSNYWRWWDIAPETTNEWQKITIDLNNPSTTVGSPTLSSINSIRWINIRSNHKVWVDDIRLGEINESWSNVTKTLNDTVGANVQWRVYANDTSNNWNASEIFSLTTTYNPYLNNCSILDQDNAIYYLTQDVSDSDYTVCMNITAENVTLDCQGHLIDGTDTADTYGIYTNQYNTTIKNCNFSDWDDTIYYNNSNDGLIYNVSVSSQATVGFTIILSNSHNNQLNNVTVSSDPPGVYYYGILIGSSNNTQLTNITANVSRLALHIFSSTNTHVSDSTLLGSYAHSLDIWPTLWLGDEYCDHTLTNVVGKDNKPILFYNNTNVTINNWYNNFSEIILCNADNSIIDNVTMNNSYGIRAWSINDANFTNIEMFNFPSSITPLYIRFGGSNRLENITSENVSSGAYIYESYGNILNNIIAKNNVYGIYLGYNSGYNNVTSGSIFNNTYDYNFRESTNYFRDTNFTGPRTIYFYDTSSWFNYNDEITGNIWLKTNVSNTSTITRKLTSWSQTLMQWNDTNSSGSDITTRYNITGLKASITYNIYNNSVLVDTLQTDSNGVLPSFTIYLSGEHEIKVDEAPYTCTGTQPPGSGDWIIEDTTFCTCKPGENITTINGSVIVEDTGNFTIENCLLYLDNPDYPKFNSIGNATTKFINSTLNSDNFWSPLLYEENSTNYLNNSNISSNVIVQDSSKNFFNNSHISHFRINSNIPHNLTIDGFNEGDLITNTIEALNSTFKIDIINTNITAVMFIASSTSNNQIKDSTFNQFGIESNVNHDLTISDFIGTVYNLDIKASNSNFEINLTNVTINGWTTFLARDSSNNTIIDSAFNTGNFLESSSNTIINSTFHHDLHFRGTSVNKISNSELGISNPNYPIELGYFYYGPNDVNMTFDNVTIKSPWIIRNFTDATIHGNYSTHGNISLWHEDSNVTRYFPTLVKDAGGNPVSGATINVTDMITNQVIWQGTTDSSGYTNLGNITFNSTNYGIGNFSIKVSKSGYNDNSTLIGFLTNTSITLVLQDITPPQIEFVPPTPLNETIQNDNSVYVNVSIIDVSQISSFIDWNRSLVGYWAMDWYNSSGVFDNSTYNNFGTFQGGLGTDNITTGKFGYGLEFDGVNDYVIVPYSSSLDVLDGNNSFTFELWLKAYALPSEVGHPINIFHQVDGGEGTGRVWINLYDDDEISTWIGGSEWGSGIIPSKDTWYYATLVYNGSHLHWYVNGSFQKSAAKTPGENSTGDYHIGRHKYDQNYWNGTIDEIRIWNRALSPEEINASYNSGLYRLYNNFTNLESGTYDYYAYAIDTSGNWNKTETRILTVDTEAPKWFDNSTNSTIAGEPTEFSLRWTDNVGLSGYIFSTNNTGSWENETWIKFRSSSDFIEVGKTTSNRSTTFPRQRKSFYANNYHWVFYSNGTDIVYSTSSDGSTWNSPIYVRKSSTPTYSSYQGNEISVSTNDTHVFYAYANCTPSGSPLIFRRGIISGNIINWDSEQVVNGSTNWRWCTPGIALNESNVPFIVSGTAWMSGGSGNDIYAVRALNQNGTSWDVEKYLHWVAGQGSMLPQAGSKMSVIFGYGDVRWSQTTDAGKTWFGAAQDISDPETIPQRYAFSSVSDGDILHTVWLNSSNFLRYRRRNDTTWGIIETVETNATDGGSAASKSFPSISIDSSTGDLYVFWYNESDDNVYYKVRYNSTETWESRTIFANIKDMQDATLSCFFKSSNNLIGCVATNGTVSPYNISYAYLTFTPKESWSNVTKTLNSMVGANVQWRVYANDTSNNWNASEIFSLTTTDETPPTIDIQQPESINYNYNVSLPLNYTVSDNGAVDECWYSLDSGNNVSLVNCQNTTFNVSQDGSHSITVYANDTSGNENYDIVYFGVDTEKPRYWDNSTNNTIAGQPTLFSLNWTDNVGLSGYIFSTNNTGSWENESFIYFPATEPEISNTILLYHLDNNTAYGENDTYVYDFSYNPVNMNGTINDNAKPNTTNYIFGGGSFEFDGSNDYIESSSNTSITGSHDWTLSAWVYIRTLDSNFHGAVSLGTGGCGKGGWLGLDDNNELAGGIGCDNTNSGVIPDLNKWYHIAHVFNGTHGLMYVNGIQSGNPNPMNPDLDDGPASVGGAYTSCCWWDGLIDEVIIYNRTLTDDEIKELYLLHTQQWSNVTKTLNSTVGALVQWRVYANDTSNNWNASEIFSLTTLPTYCDYTIQKWELPYTITQNNSYYCLASDSYIGGQTAITFANPTQNSTLDCLGYTIDGNDTSGARGIYLNGTETKNNIIQNCIITDFNDGIVLDYSVSNTTIINNTISSCTRGTHLRTYSSNNSFVNNRIHSNSLLGVWIEGYCDNNVLINNTIWNMGTYGVLIGYGSDNNNITGGSIHGTSGYDYAITGPAVINRFIETNFTEARKIYLLEANRLFTYNNESLGNIWLTTNSSEKENITRELTSWSQSLIQWNDTSNNSVVLGYNITGLLPNTYYKIYNNSVLVYILQTDSDGVLPSFKIYLSGEHEIKVEPNCNYPDVGNWVISDNQTCENVTIVMKGNVAVQSGGSLTFKNVTLKMNDSIEMNGIEVENGGKMFIYDNDNNKDTSNDASNITGLSTSNNFYFIVNSGAEFIMKNSYLSKCGNPSVLPLYGGLIIRTNNVEILNNTFDNNYRSIQIYGSSSSNNLVANNIVKNSQNIGIGIYGSNSYNNTVTDNILISNAQNIHICTNAHDNLITRNNITGGTYAIYLHNSATSNNFTYNSISSANFGIYIIQNSNNNLFANSSVSNSGTCDYYFRDTTTTNNFINMNWTEARSIYFYDSIPWFNYNNETTGNIWLKNNVSSAVKVTRKLTSWSQALMQWNDTSSSAVTARYNLTGLKAGRTYYVYNDSVLTYTLQTDNEGNLPSFTIYLSGEHEIKVEEDSIPPQIEFVPPTPLNETIQNDNSVYVNVSITDISQTSSFIDWNRSLVGYWSMDWYNSSGIFDNSTYNNFGKFGTSIGIDNIVIGKFGNGLKLYGNHTDVNDYINVGNSSCLNITGSLAIEVWIKVNVFNETDIFVHKGWMEIAGYLLGTGWQTNEILFLLVNETGQNNVIRAYNSVEIGNWSHIVATFDGSIMKLYKNGILIGSNNFVGNYIKPTTNNLIINKGDDELNGTIDEVRIWNRALSPEEINASYNSGLYRLYHNFTDLNDGSYEYYAYAIDTSGNWNKTETRTLTVDTQAPKWFDNKTSPTSPTTYSPGKSYQFNVTWSDNFAIDTVLIEHNFTGSSTPHNDSFTGNVTSEYYFYVSDLKAGIYVWRSFANDTSDNWNLTSQWTYVVNKAPTETNLLLNGEDNDKVYYIPSNANFTVTVNVSGEIVYLDTNISGWVTQSDTTPLYNYTSLSNEGTYNITGYYLGNENYSSSHETHYAIVSANYMPKWSNITTSPMSPTTYSPGKSYQFNVTCVDEDTGMYNAWLTFDGTKYSMDNKSSEYYVTLTDLSAGTHSYNFTCNDTQSGTNTTNDLSYVINKASTTIYLELNGTPGNRIYTYPEDINATGWKTVGQDSSLTLYRDGISVGTKVGNIIYEYFDPGAHVYNYTIVLTATNYTTSPVQRLATVNKASTETRVYLNGTRGDESYAPNTTANLTVTLDIPGKTVSLNTGLAGWVTQSDTTPLYNYTKLTDDPGVYFVTGSFAGDENYSASSETHYLTILTPMLITVNLNATEVWWGNAVNISGVVKRLGLPISNVKVGVEVANKDVCINMPNTTSQGEYTCVFNAPFAIGTNTVRVQSFDNTTNTYAVNTTTLDVKIWWGGTEEELRRARNVGCYEVPKIIQNPDGTVKRVVVRMCVWK